MQRIRYIVFLLAVLLLTAGVLQAQEEGVLHVVTANDIDTLDPAIGYGALSWGSEPLVYRGLVVYDETGTVVGALADTIDVSEDGLTYTFTIRDGAKFSNGRQVTADDVKFTFERFFAPATASPGTFIYDMIEGVQPVMDGTTTEISGITVLDEKTVQFTLTRPEYTFLIRLALPFGSIVAKEGVEAAGEDFARKPLGAGPYMLESWDSGLQATFVRNPYYYDTGKPIIDKIVYDIGVEAATGYLRVESGEADLSLDPIEGADYTHVATDPNLADQALRSVGFPQVTYITMDANQPPFDNPLVREAVNYAIDRERLVQISAGLGTPANGIVPPVVPGHNTEVPTFAYDPDHAKELLAQAGYPDGFETAMLTFNFPGPLRISQAVVQDLQQVGITVQLDQLDIGPYLDLYFSNPAPYPLVFSVWGMDYADPTDAYEPLIECGASSNPGAYCNEEIDAKMKAAAQIPPGDERWAAFAAVEAEYVQDLPWIFLLFPQSYYFHSDRLNIASHPAYIYDFANASFK